MGIYHTKGMLPSLLFISSTFGLINLGTTIGLRIIFLFSWINVSYIFFLSSSALFPYILYIKSAISSCLGLAKPYTWDKFRYIFLECFCPLFIGLRKFSNCFLTTFSGIFSPFSLILFLINNLFILVKSLGCKDIFDDWWYLQLLITDINKD